MHNLCQDLSKTCPYRTEAEQCVSLEGIVHVKQSESLVNKRHRLNTTSLSSDSSISLCICPNLHRHTTLGTVVWMNYSSEFVGFRRRQLLPLLQLGFSCCLGQWFSCCLSGCAVRFAAPPVCVLCPVQSFAARINQICVVLSIALHPQMCPYMFFLELYIVPRACLMFSAFLSLLRLLVLFHLLRLLL